jgi:hypothetical protein
MTNKLIFYIHENTDIWRNLECSLKREVVLTKGSSI